MSPFLRPAGSGAAFGAQREVAGVEVMVNVGEELAGFGEGALFGEAGSPKDRGGRLFFDRRELRLARRSLLEDVGGESGNAVLRAELRLFLLTAVEQGVVRAEVPEVAIGLRLDQSRPLARTSAPHRFARHPRTSRGHPARPR